MPGPMTLIYQRIPKSKAAWCPSVHFSSAVSLNSDLVVQLLLNCSLVHDKHHQELSKTVKIQTTIRMVKRPKRE